jgi:hypothetical protein
MKFTFSSIWWNRDKNGQEAEAGWGDIRAGGQWWVRYFEGNLKGNISLQDWSDDGLKCANETEKSGV